MILMYKTSSFHEICGSIDGDLFVDCFESDYNFMMQEAFEEETHLLNDNAKISVWEYFASAFEHLMLNRNKNGLILTQSIIDYVVERLDYLAEKVESDSLYNPEYEYYSEECLCFIE